MISMSNFVTRMWCGPHWWKDLSHEKWQVESDTSNRGGLHQGWQVYERESCLDILTTTLKEWTRIDYEYQNVIYFCIVFSSCVFFEQHGYGPLWTFGIQIELELVRVFFFGNLPDRTLNFHFLWWADEDDMIYRYAMFFGYMIFMWKVRCIIWCLCSPCTHTFVYMLGVLYFIHLHASV